MRTSWGILANHAAWGKTLAANAASTIRSSAARGERLVDVRDRGAAVPVPLHAHGSHPEALALARVGSVTLPLARRLAPRDPA